MSGWWAKRRLELHDSPFLFVGFCWILSHIHRVAHGFIAFSAMPESGLPPLLLQLVLILKSVAVITRSIVQKLIKLFKPEESCRGPGIAFPCCLLGNQNTNYGYASNINSTRGLLRR